MIFSSLKVVMAIHPLGGLCEYNILIEDAKRENLSADRGLGVGVRIILRQIMKN
jgi:hypothetical protein